MRIKTASLKNFFESRTALLLVITGAAVLRITNLTKESLWLDEIYSISFVAARNALHVVRDTFSIDFHPFSYYLLLDIWTGVFGISDYSARLLSALLGTGAVFTAWLLVKTLFKDKRAAVLCAFLAAVSPYHITFSQEVRMYVLLLLVWPLFLCAQYKCVHTRYSLKYSLLLLAAFAVFAYAHSCSGLFALPLLVLCAGIFAVRSPGAKHRRGAVRAAAVALCGTVLYLPWLNRLISLKASAKQLGTFGVNEALHFFPILLSRHDVFSSGLLLAGIIAAPCMLLLLFRRRRLWTGVAAPVLPLLASIAAVIMIQFLLSFFRPLYKIQNLIFLLPPVLACASVIIVRLMGLSQSSDAARFSSRFTYPLVLVLCSVFILSTVICTIHQIKCGYRKEQWREAVFCIEPKIQRGDILAFYAGFTHICWEHYARGRGIIEKNDSGAPEYLIVKIPRTGSSAEAERSVNILISTMRRKINPCRALWMFYSHVNNAGHMDALLNKAGLRETHTWTGIGIGAKCYLLEQPYNNDTLLHEPPRNTPLF